MPRVKDNKPLARKRPFYWISIKSRLVRAAMETSKFQNWLHLTNSRRHYMAEILPIRRFNSIQSIQSIITKYVKYRRLHGELQGRLPHCYPLLVLQGDLMGQSLGWNHKSQAPPPLLWVLKCRFCCFVFEWDVK